jgi:hypothetical protein
LTRRRARSGSWPSHRRVSHRLRRPFVTQPQRRFIRIHPSRLSLTRFAWMVQARLGLHPSALARHVTGALARVRNRPGHWSGPVLTHHRPLIWSDFVSHALYETLTTLGAVISAGIRPRKPTSPSPTTRHRRASRTLPSSAPISGLREANISARMTPVSKEPFTLTAARCWTTCSPRSRPVAGDQDYRPWEQPGAFRLDYERTPLSVPLVTSDA